MQSETRQCQNCKQPFTIEPDDFAFYEKMKVPPPTWCPECRWRRQLSFRNERSLYKRPCNVPGHQEALISVYAPDSPIKVYDQKYWWSDEWEALTFGRAYNFSRNFFEQVGELIYAVPWPNVVNTNAVNSDYCNSSLDMKNCYLIFSAIGVENSAYGANVDFTKESFDLKNSIGNELCYEIVHCHECFKVFFSDFSDQCTDSAFLQDCRGCSNCFGCVGLRNKSYFIFNKPYGKEEYEKKMKEFNLGDYPSLLKVMREFSEFKMNFPRRYAHLQNSVNTTGDNVRHGKDCVSCFDVHGESLESSQYMFLTYKAAVKECQSICVVSAAEFCYDSVSIRQCSNVLFSKKIWAGHDIRYSYNCHNCANLFGCVGLRNKQYCILNKQYTKEEYEALVSKIIAHMNDMPYADSQGRIYRYGEFFPAELSPFAYNETIAQEYFPMTKEGALSQGYRWRDPDTKQYAITKQPNNQPDHIKDVDEGILKETIGCAHEGSCAHQCTTAFKIIPEELKFYQRMNLPLPRLCPNCRHYLRLARRNPIKLWRRKCECAGAKSESDVYQNTANHPHGAGKCLNEFETSYAPERPEIIYCEACYNAEVV